MIIDILFKILNFILFVAIVTYYFRVKMVPAIAQDIKKQKASHDDLMRQDLMTTIEYRSLHEELEHQKELYVILEKKVTTWKQAVQLQRIQQIDALKRNEDTIQKHVNNQMNFIQESSLIKNIAPRLFSEVSQELHTYFQENKHGEQFNQTIIKRVSNL